MNAEQIPDIVAGLAVAVTIVIAVWIAYRRGFHAALPIHLSELDFLTTSLALDGTRWTLVKEPSADQLNPLQLPDVFDWQQVGSRVTGQSGGKGDSIWEVEGIAEGRMLTCVARQPSHTNHRTSVWMLRCNPSGDKLTGYCLCWDAEGSRLSVREFSLVRQSAEPGLAGDALPDTSASDQNA